MSTAPNRNVAPPEPAQIAVIQVRPRFATAAFAAITAGPRVRRTTASVASQEEVAVQPDADPRMAACCPCQSSGVLRLRGSAGSGPAVWEGSRGVLLDADLDQRLQEAQLQGALLR